MPGHYELRGNVIHIEIEGELTLELAREARQWIQSLPSEPPMLKQIIDLRKVTSATITPAQVNSFAAERVFPHPARRAIIARHAFVYGLAREFQAHIDANLGDDIQIFYTAEAALNWVNQGEAPPAPRH